MFCAIKRSKFFSKTTSSLKHGADEEEACS